MNTDVYALIQRAELLISQQRYSQAESQLHQALAAAPDHARAHSLLGLCLAQDRDKLHEATREAEQAIHLAPDDGFTHYVLATILDRRNRQEPALAAVDQAIAIDPQSAAFHGFRAHLLSRRSKWRDALTAAETGLSLDPEDSQCAAIRVFALERLGRVSDAVAEAESAIRQNPDSADAHASRGWALLQKGQIRQSQESFREALRLEPSSEFARAGMMQALNSSNFVFRFFYRILNWLSRLDSRFQFGLLIGLWLGMNALQTLAKSNPWLSRWILPISVCYLLFVMMSWIIHPLFNTLLRFHPFGRHLLSKKEVWASNLIAGTLSFGVVIGVASSLRNGGPIHALLPILHSIYLTIPISVAFAARVKGAQITAIVVAIGFGLLYLLNSGLAIAGLFANTLIMAFTYGIVVYCFVGQRLMSGEPQH